MNNFVEEARKSGEPVLARWFGDDRWHCVVWAAPSGYSHHWCIEGKWTPGPDPIAFCPMPSFDEGVLV